MPQIISSAVLQHQICRHVAKCKYLYLYWVCKIWYQCIIANYIALSLSDSVERSDVTVCMWFSWVVKLCITCIAG